MYKKVVLLLLVALLFSIQYSCRENSAKKIIRKKQGAYFIEAKFKGDKIIDGIAKYYDQEGHLISTAYYKDDLKNGPAHNFYLNGKIKDSMFYINGLINGNTFNYDSFGRLNKTESYYYGIPIGHNIFYHFDKPFEYFFNDFNANTIFSCKYDSLGKCIIGKSIFNPITDIVENDEGKHVMRLFLYFPKPPNLSILYQFGLVNDKNQIMGEYFLNSDRLFLDSILYQPENGWHYYISTHIETKGDSLNKVFFYDLKW